MDIAVLLTSFNRKQKTLECLKALNAAEIPSDYNINIFLVDDGSTDGTSDSVRKQFPHVKLIKGNGNLFWNGGMRLAWNEAFKSYSEYDFYLWLNDDTLLISNAIQCLISTSKKYKHKCNIVGTTCSIEEPERITYGGRNKKNGLIIPQEIPIECEFFNGNIVLVPKYVFKKIGMHDARFRHALGDFDYGMRAKREGIVNILAPGVLGGCDAHIDLPIWCNPKFTFKKRWQMFRSPLGNNPEEFFIYELRHGGILMAFFHYFTNHLRVLIPSLWNSKVTSNYQ